MQTITQMNKKLNELNHLFTNNTSNFMHTIRLHQTRFSQQDVNDFERLIKQIKIQVNERVENFFRQKIQKNSLQYQNKIENYSSSSQNLYQKLLKFRKQIQDKTCALKLQQKRKQMLLDHFSQKFYQNSLIKKHLNQLKKNVIVNQQEKAKIQKANQMYKNNLIKKTFFPWRTLTYKDGYQNTVIRQTQSDIQNIHQQYSSIINILKSKIKDTDQLIKLKKAAKGQFSYALSKNLMKTISNLSLEVMSLNQISLRDQQYDNSDQQRLMRKIDSIVGEKINTVRKYKENLCGTDPNKKKQKKITFI